MRQRPPITNPAQSGESEASTFDAWSTSIIGTVWAWLLIALSKTWRIRTDGVDMLDHSLAAGRPLAVVFWHGHYLMLCAALRGRHICVFTSLSKRGRILDALAQSLGMTASMIPDRGGEASYQMMKAGLLSDSACAIAVDGPLGPYHSVKAGAVRLASEIGLEVFPTAAVARKALTIRSRWDRITIPLPFTTVGVAVAPSFSVPSDLARGDVQSWSERVHQSLDEVAAKAKQLAA